MGYKVKSMTLWCRGADLHLSLADADSWLGSVSVAREAMLAFVRVLIWGVDGFFSGLCRLARFFCYTKGSAGEILHIFEHTGLRSSVYSSYESESGASEKSEFE